MGTVSTYGQPRTPVRFEPMVFEAYGGFGFTATELWKEFTKYAVDNSIGINYRSEASEARNGPHDFTWSAQSFSPFHAQSISWTIVHSTAVGVFNGLSKSSAAAAAYRLGH